MLPNPEEEFRKKLMLIIALVAVLLYIVLLNISRRYMQ